MHKAKELSVTRKSIILLIIMAVSFVAAGASDGAEKTLKERLLGDPDAQWQITADKMSYMEREALVIAEGNVVATRTGQVLHARKAVYNQETGFIEVSGDVRFETNGDYLLGERATFDLETQTGQVTDARLFMRENNFHVNGDSMEKLGPDTYLVKDALVTTCDSASPPWSITATEVKVTIEGYGVVKNGVFRIRGFPVFWVPYGFFPAKTVRQSGVLPPALGYSDRNGAEFELPIFWAISDQTDATFYEHYMSERGMMQGLEWRYVAEKDSKGVFLFDILSDNIEQKDLSDPEQSNVSPFERTNQTRYWFRSKAEQEMPLGVRARLDTDYLSDQDYLREFQHGLWGYRGRPDLVQEFGRPVEEVLSPLRTSRIRFSRDQASYSLQGHSSYYQRTRDIPFDTTPQPLGGAMYSLLPRSVFGEPLYVRFRSDVDYIWRDHGDRGQRIFLGPELTRPFWLSPFVEFQPSVGFSRAIQFYEREDGSSDEQSRDAYDLQARLSTLVEKTFDFAWGETRKLKHKVFPSLLYRYRGYNDASKYQPWFEPIDQENRTKLVSFSRTSGQATDPRFDRIGVNQNVVAFSLANFLDARNENAKGEVTYKQWGTLELVQGYDIGEARRDDQPLREERPFEPLMGIVTAHPFPNVDLDSEVWWDHYENEVVLSDTILEFNVKRSGGRTDRYGLEYLYIRDGNESIGYNVHLNLTESIAAGTSLHRNLNLDRSVGARYYVQYLSQCWGIRVSVESFAGIDSFMVSFTLLGLGELGNW
ncbi:MAG: LPS-assembly protein LptD [Desulfobacteraceae bacterium]|nr:MAG: LPS-assembly protein LptD [Desulfobacteraceae bacterium]